MSFFDNTSLPSLSKVMNLAAWRQRVLSGNVANASTPGYERREARFADELAAAGGMQLATTEPGHLGLQAAGDPVPQVVRDPQAKGPGIDLDQEMVALAENQLRFDLASHVASLRVAGIRAAITGHK
jgi:flagellar basal-body rod protein FlgB